MIFINNRNLLTFLMACEVAYFSISIGFVMHGFDTGMPSGLIYGAFVLVAAVSESVIGLGLIAYLTKFSGTIDFAKLNLTGFRS